MELSDPEALIAEGWEDPHVYTALPAPPQEGQTHGSATAQAASGTAQDVAVLTALPIARVR